MPPRFEMDRLPAEASAKGKKRRGPGDAETAIPEPRSSVYFHDAVKNRGISSALGVKFRSFENA